MFANRPEWVNRAALLIQNERGGTGLTTEFISGQADSTCVTVSRFVPAKVSATLIGDGTTKRVLEAAPLTGVTGTASTDVLAKASHGLSNGDIVVLRLLSGGTGLTANYSYYVIAATSSEFQLAETSGGAAVNFTTDITSVSVIETGFVPPSVATPWVAGFSRVEWIEYPVDQTPRDRWRPEEWELFPDGETATHIYFLDRTPGSGDTVRLQYTTLHVIDDDSSSVADYQEPGFEFALASDACLAYSARYGHSTRSGIVGDSVDGLAKMDPWQKLSDMFRTRAEQSLGVSLDGDNSGAASGGSVEPYGRWVDFDPPDSGLLLRNRRYR